MLRIRPMSWSQAQPALRQPPLLGCQGQLCVRSGASGQGRVFRHLRLGGPQEGPSTLPPSSQGNPAGGEGGHLGHAAGGAGHSRGGGRSLTNI